MTSEAGVFNWTGLDMGDQIAARGLLPRHLPSTSATSITFADNTDGKN